MENRFMGEDRTVVLHPVRLRILQAALGREVTTRQLAEALPDVPIATLYRHVTRLLDANVLEVVSEQAVHGAIERTLRVSQPAASLGPEVAARMTGDEHRAAITGFLAGVLQAAHTYLTQPDAAPATDGYGFRQEAFWADDGELEEVVTALRTSLAAAAGRAPGPGRRRRVLTTVLLPDPTAGKADAECQSADLT